VARTAGTKGNRLRARCEADAAEREQQHLAARRRPLERHHEQQGDEEEEGIERVLRHQHPRVEERREENRQHGCDKRIRRRHEPAREEIRGNGRERHHDGVDVLRNGVRVRHGVEEPKRRRDQGRVDEPVAVTRHPTHEEVPVRRERLRELRVDELVRP